MGSDPGHLAAALQAPSWVQPNGPCKHAAFSSQGLVGAHSPDDIISFSALAPYGGFLVQQEAPGLGNIKLSRNKNEEGKKPFQEASSRIYM